MNIIFEIVLLLYMMTDSALGHGRLMEPPNRSSLWRFPDDPAINPYMDIVEPNYNDNQLFCGGFQHQQSLGGKCGVCGDPYDGPRDNEAGGKYAKGIVVRQYDQGSTLPVDIELTAYHKGFFEFRLCPWNDPLTPITEDCLDQYLMLNENDSTRYYPDAPSGTTGWYNMNLVLPQNINCTQCVLQWKYHTGNSYGCFNNGSCCVGCGPQEEFYGCADISIGTTNLPTPPNEYFNTTTTSSQTSTTSSTTTTTSQTTTSSTTTGSTTATTSSTTEGETTNPCEGETEIVMKDCCSFYKCSQSEEVAVMDCPPGTVFNIDQNACDYAYNTPPPCGTKESER